MARALDAIARADVESPRRFQFQLPPELLRSWYAKTELDRAVRCKHWESVLALELAHNYVHSIKVDRNVGLLAAVGEGMQGQAGPGLPHLYRNLARAGEHHRHRPGLERTHHRRSGAP